MEYEVTIGVSNRHIHLTEEVYNMLFDEPITKFKDLNQLGEFASEQKVTLIAGDHEIPGVRLLGPFREYCQVEISHNDALKFKLNPPVRRSGDLSRAEKITIKTDKAQITLPVAILAQRHVHMNPAKAQELGVVDGQKVEVRIAGERGGIMEAFVKISDNGYYEMHIDTDEANAFLIDNNNNKGTLIVK